MLVKTTRILMWAELFPGGGSLFCHASRGLLPGPNHDLQLHIGVVAVVSNALLGLWHHPLLFRGDPPLRLNDLGPQTHPAAKRCWSGTYRDPITLLAPPDPTTRTMLLLKKLALNLNDKTCQAEIHPSPIIKSVLWNMQRMKDFITCGEST